MADKLVIDNCTVSSIHDKDSVTELNTTIIDIEAVNMQASVLNCDNQNMVQSGLPVVLEQGHNSAAVPLTSNLSSEYLVVMENPDGSQVLTRLITGNMLANIDSSTVAATHSLLESHPSLRDAFSASSVEQQPVTVMLSGTAPQLSQLVTQDLLLDSNPLVSQSSQSKFLSQSSFYGKPDISENIDKRCPTFSVTESGLKAIDSSECYLTNVDGQISTKASRKVMSKSSYAKVDRSVVKKDNVIKPSSSDVMTENKKKIIITDDDSEATTTITDSRFADSFQKNICSEDEVAKLKKLMEDQRLLVQSHLQHHIKQSKKKYLESIKENVALPEEMKRLEDLGFTDDTPLFLDVAAELNNAFLEHIPGCEQFLLDLEKESPNSIKKCDKNWLFKGDLKALIELYNSIKCLIKLKTKSFIRFQTFEESSEEGEPPMKSSIPVNEKAITCNLLVPYISSKGRQLKQSHRFTGATYVHLPDSFIEQDDLEDQNDEEYGRTLPGRAKRSGRRRKRNSIRVDRQEQKFKQENLYLQYAEGNEFVNDDSQYHSGFSQVSVINKEDLEIVSETSNSKAIETSSEDLDPLQNRLLEEQMKYNKNKHPVDESPEILILRTDIELNKYEANSSTPKPNHSVDPDKAPDKKTEFTSKRRGRPPKKYDNFVTTEKMRPRNPLTESAQTKQQRNYEENMAFKFFCSECSFKTKRQSHFLNHLQYHKDGSAKKYSCKECDFISISPIMLKRHELKHKKTLYRCTICAVYTTDRPVLLQRHMRQKHSESAVSKQFLCVQCSFVSTTSQGLARHIHTHLRDEHDQGEEISHTCPKCSKVLRNLMHLKRHMRDVHGPERRPHLCHTCGKAFKRTDALQQHQVVHQERSKRVLPFRCETCFKAFRSQAHLKEHLSMHSTDRPFLCQYCGASFKTQPVQKKHILTLHIKPKTHVCAVCCRQFNTKHALQRHESTHHKSDPATEIAILEMQKSEKVEMDQTPEIIEVVGGEAALSMGCTTTITVDCQSSNCLVQDLISSVSAQTEEEMPDQSGQSLQQNFIQGNQENTMYNYFSEEL